MSSADRAAELRALADRLETTAAHEDEAREAKDAYRAALDVGDPQQIADAKARHRQAAQALTESRAATRSDVLVGPASPGSATVRVNPVRAGGSNAPTTTVTEG